MRDWLVILFCLFICASCTTRTDKAATAVSRPSPTQQPPDRTVTPSSSGEHGGAMVHINEAQKLASKKEPSSKKESDIKTEPIKRRRGSLSLHLPGRLEPDFGKEVDISTRIAGRIKQVLVNPGDTVAAKQRLLIVDSREISQLQAELIESKAKWQDARDHEESERQIYQERISRPKALLAAKNNFSQAKIKKELAEGELNRVKGLLQEHISSSKDYVAAKATLATAQAQFDQTQADLQREERLYKNQALMKMDYKLAQDKSAQEKEHMDTLYQRLEFLGTDKARMDRILATGKIDGAICVLSPVAGVVSHYDVAVGEVVQPVKSLMKITDLSTVLVQAELPVRKLSLAKIDSRATIKIDCYPDERFQATIKFISEHVNSETRTVTIRARLANPLRKLKTNMLAEIDLNEPRREYLACPKAAIQDCDGHKVVFVAAAHGFEARRVTVGSADGDYVEVFSGLEEGKRVATSGSLRLKTDLNCGHRPSDSKRGEGSL